MTAKKENNSGNGVGKSAMSSAATLLGTSWATLALMHDPVKNIVPDLMQEGLQQLQAALSETKAGQVINSMGTVGGLPCNAAAVTIGATVAAVSFPIFLNIYKNRNTESHVEKLTKKEEQPSTGIAP